MGLHQGAQVGATRVDFDAQTPSLTGAQHGLDDIGKAGAGADAEHHLEALGIAYLCAPVSGNAKVAKAGKLLLVASGPKALYDANEKYLAAMSRKAMWVGEGELARVWKIAHNTMFGVIIQSLCEITVLAEKAGIPRHVFLESINDSVLGSMYTRYKSPVLTNLTFEQVTFTPKLLLKDMDLGLELDATAFGMGLRAKRFALYAEDGVVKQLHVEAPGEFKVSAADYVLEHLPA
mgnify:CR=1 FL=1